ncbi:MAG: SulP family inorganic anion transporter [Spirochaetia bacterium]|nr:SulP family inorganic anion transporter [Spirochaetia bacterium]
MKIKKKIDLGEFFGGIAATLVALPSAIAFGLIIYSPLGPEYSSRGVISGIIGAVTLGLIAAIFSGTPKLISAPCAPAAAVLSVFVAELLNSGVVLESIPGYIIVVAAGAGTVQFIFGLFKGGAFIKYIPYPVVAGYLGGVGSLIVIGQLPKFFGISSVKSLSAFFSNLPNFKWETVLIGSITIIVMGWAPKFIKTIFLLEMLV